MTISPSLSGHRTAPVPPWELQPSPEYGLKARRGGISDSKSKFQDPNSKIQISRSKIQDRKFESPKVGSPESASGARIQRGLRPRPNPKCEIRNPKETQNPKSREDNCIRTAGPQRRVTDGKFGRSDRMPLNETAPPWAFTGDYGV
jgi:hypothetical protein